jgi:hypothetical protein
VLEWPIDDLDYGARYLLSREVLFIALEPPQLREAFRRLAREAEAIADGAAPAR